MAKLVETVIFCAVQNIALRSHDESESSSNKGDFLELVELRKKDTGVLNDKIAYKYLSKDAQNEIIDIISSKIKKRLQKNVLISHSL